MSDLLITIRVPESLVERAKAAGIAVEDRVEAQTEQFVASLENEIKSAEAARSLLDLMDQIDALPDEIKPTPQEIDAEISAYHSEKQAKA